MRSACCSTAAAWPSSRPSPRAEPRPRGPRGLRQVGAAPDRDADAPARREQGRHRQRHRVAQPARDRRSTSRQAAIDAALEELPSALTSLDQQRDDLVKMLKALNQLGDVGVRVIQASKQSTIESFRAAVAGADRAGQLRRRLRQRLPRVPDLPVRRRGGRPRPAGRPQPAHGRLHQPVDRAGRHRHRRGRHRPADQPAARPRPRPDRRHPSRSACAAATSTASRARRCWPRRRRCSSCARSAPSRRTRTRTSASSSTWSPACRPCRDSVSAPARTRAAACPDPRPAAGGLR